MSNFPLRDMTPFIPATADMIRRAAAAEVAATRLRMVTHCPPEQAYRIAQHPALALNLAQAIAVSGLGLDQIAEIISGEGVEG